ncbi:hypothetical protein J437_LFUL013327 [Ladona fulva]|uniref:C2H2-type domain-containing protein n=1 Tax=Ladona fulva TaxID=123851 RepID=A0A8K0KHG4_LADFU|nr:hypothetical protein J437_LFUL013327 [Ladona fulva]
MLDLRDDDKGPQTPSWLKDGSSGTINYKEYHKSEILYNANEPEIKQEPEEEGNLPEMCDDADEVRREKMTRKDTEKRNMDTEGLKEDCSVVIKAENVEVGVTVEDDMYCHHCGENKRTKLELKEHIFNTHLSILIAKEKEDIIINQLLRGI